MRQVQLQRRAEGQDRRVSGQEEQVWEAVENEQNKVGWQERKRKERKGWMALTWGSDGQVITQKFWSFQSRLREELNALKKKKKREAIQSNNWSCRSTQYIIPIVNNNFLSNLQENDIQEAIVLSKSRMKYLKTKVYSFKWLILKVNIFAKIQ